MLPLPHPVKCENGLLLNILDRHEAHVRSPDDFADRLRIGRVIFVCLDVRLDELWSHHAHGVTHCLQFARPVIGMCIATCPHADEARWQVNEKRRHLGSLELLLQHLLAVLINAVDLEHVLCQVKMVQMTVNVTSIFPRVAFEYGHME